MVAVSSPTVLRRYVALELRRLREVAGLKREEVAKELRCSLAHVGHVETMFALPKVPEVRALLDLYHARDRADDFIDLVDAARLRKDWFADYPGIPKDFELLLGMENGAATIHCFDAMVVRGLFQTPSYAETVIRADIPKMPEAEIKRRLELRQVRQDVLYRQPDPLKVWCVLDEAVLHRRLAKPGVLREQLDELIRLSHQPYVHIQVLPFAASGVHPGMDGTFTVFTFPPELVGDPGVVYTESLVRGTYYEDAAEVAEYRDIWSEVQLLALDPDASRELIGRRMAQIEEDTP